MKNSTKVIGFRMVYRDLAMTGSLTTVFRPDRPKYEKIFKPGIVVSGGIIKRPGNGYGRQPVFTEDELIIRIKTFKRVRLKNLKPRDFSGSSPDVKHTLDLIYHLGLIYNQPASDFSPNTRIVKIELEYLSINGERP